MQADIAAGRTANAKSSPQRGKSARKRARGGVATGGNGVAARSLGMLRTILEHAARKGLIVSNPARSARKLAGQKRTSRLNLDQLRLLGKAMRGAAAEGENPVGLAAIRFMILSGCRRHEA
jgi:hypothetical protein